MLKFLRYHYIMLFPFLSHLHLLLLLSHIPHNLPLSLPFATQMKMFWQRMTVVSWLPHLKDRLFHGPLITPHHSTATFMASSSSACSLSVSVPHILSFLLFFLFKWSHHLPFSMNILYNNGSKSCNSPPDLSSFLQTCIPPGHSTSNSEHAYHEVPILHFPPHSSLSPSFRDKHYHQPSGPNQNVWAHQWKLLFLTVFLSALNDLSHCVNSILLLNLKPGHFFPFS